MLSFQVNNCSEIVLAGLADALNAIHDSLHLPTTLFERSNLGFKSLVVCGQLGLVCLEFGLIFQQLGLLRGICGLLLVDFRLARREPLFGLLFVLLRVEISTLRCINIGESNVQLLAELLLLFRMRGLAFPLLLFKCGPCSLLLSRGYV